MIDLRTEEPARYSYGVYSLICKRRERDFRIEILRGVDIVHTGSVAVDRIHHVIERWTDWLPQIEERFRSTDAY